MADDRPTSADCSKEFDKGGFVEVMFAKSQHEAADLCNLLAERSIPACFEQNAGTVSRAGIAVLVPPDYLVEASELLGDLDIGQDGQEDEFDDLGDDEDEYEDEDDEEDEEEEDEDDDYDDGFDDDDEDDEYEDLEEDDDV